MRIEIGIPTKNRPRVLGRCVACLLDQTYEEWDLTIVNDSPDVPLDQITLDWLSIISENGHRVQVVQAGGWGQPVAHNWVLYNTEHPAVLRLDDDILLNCDALDNLVNALLEHPQAGAVAGLYFYPDERYEMPQDWEADPYVNGKVQAELNSHKQQVSYHFARGNAPQPIEHLYSSCLYWVDAMKLVGGWPEVYSVGIAAGEETDGTYKLHLAGYTLLVIPTATGVHLWAEGGIRSGGQGDVQVAYQRDTALFVSRLEALRSTNFHRPKVGVFGQFQYGIGGAQKLFYKTVAQLQAVPGLDVYPIFHGPYWSPDETENLFGYRYEMRAEPVYVDVLINIGHQVFDVVANRRLIQYTLFPDPSGELHRPAAFVSISPFAAEWTGRRWSKPSRYIYPPVRPIPPAEKKEKWILVVGRLEPAKAYKELIDVFLDIKQGGRLLRGWQLHVIGATTQGAHTEYEEEIGALCREHPDVILHDNISRAEVEELYGKARVLWAAKGLRAHETPEYRPDLCEHYGYTAVEAATAGCVPVVFDDGGYRYTVPDELRWGKLEDLKRITLELAQKPEWMKEMAQKAQDKATSFCDPQWYVIQWERLIRRVNGLSVDCREPEIVVKGQPLRVGCIVDHPSLTLGFAVVARQILVAFHRAGYQVSALASYCPPTPRFGSDLPYPVWRSCKHSVDGMDYLSEWLHEERPDVIWINKDIGAVGEYLAEIQRIGFDVPVVAYFPVEGLPLWRGYAEIIKALTVPVTYLKFAAEAIEKKTGRKAEWLSHGVDHARWERLPDEERKRLRQAIGWENKWVVGYVGRNKEVKAQWRLLYALALFQPRAAAVSRIGAVAMPPVMDDLILYLHCRKTEYGWNKGFDLDDVEAQLGVGEKVYYPPFDAPGRGVPFDGSGGTSSRSFKQVFAGYSLNQIYNCLNMYIHPAEAGGFELPPLEAMACGVPVAITNDHEAMSEVVGDAAILMNPESQRVWYTMANLKQVSPLTIARVIVGARENPARLQELAERGMERAKEFRWEPTCQRMVQIVAEAHQAHREQK